MIFHPKIQKNVLLAPFSSFKIGGPAKYFCEAASIEDIQNLCVWAKEKNIPVFILGGGSNVLISDKGFNGLVIKTQDARCKVQNEEIFVSAGLPLAKLVSEGIRSGLSGLEWAIGIPGTVGGAINGNAGAFGHSVSDNIKEIKVFDINELRIINYELADCDFGYRSSVFKYSPHLVILEAVFLFEKKESNFIRGRMRDYLSQRTESFGAGQKCAGCFFKNIEWKRKDIDKKRLLIKFPELKRFASQPKISAGFLIDFLGLKGKKIGDAIISTQHANFVVNLNDATAEQIVMLSSLVKHKIYSNYGFNLEEEIKLIGFDN